MIRKQTLENCQLIACFLLDEIDESITTAKRESQRNSRTAGEINEYLVAVLRFAIEERAVLLASSFFDFFFFFTLRIIKEQR